MSVGCITHHVLDAPAALQPVAPGTLCHNGILVFSNSPACSSTNASAAVSGDADKAGATSTSPIERFLSTQGGVPVVASAAAAFAAIVVVVAAVVYRRRRLGRSKFPVQSPNLSLQADDSTAVPSLPTHAPGYDLESAPDLGTSTHATA